MLKNFLSQRADDTESSLVCQGILSQLVVAGWDLIPVAKGNRHGPRGRNPLKRGFTANRFLRASRYRENFGSVSLSGGSSGFGSRKKNSTVAMMKAA
jgi:hypothetical protein